MSTGTITSIYPMRKRRYQDSVADPTNGKGKLSLKTIPTKCVASSSKVNTVSQAVSPRTSASRHSPSIRQTVKDTSVRFLCSQSDSRPEISWNCNSPEFEHSSRSSFRNHGSATDNDLLNLVQSTFKSTPGKNEPGKNNLLALWMAPSDENALHAFPKETRPTTFSGFNTNADKHQVGKELEQLLAKVESEKAVQKRAVDVLEETPLHIRRQETVSNPSTNPNIDSRNNEEQVNNNELNANTEDVWDDEDLFNDENFIAQTQQLIAAHVEMISSQAPTQVIEIEETDLNESHDEILRDITIAKVDTACMKSNNTVPNVKTSNPMTATTVEAKLEQDKIDPKNKSEPLNGLDDFWNCDDGFDEIFCSLKELENKEDSLDMLLNCTTQPYPSPVTQFTNSSAESITERMKMLDQNKDKPSTEEKLVITAQPRAQKSPWAFKSLPQFNASTSSKNGPIIGVLNPVCKTISSPNKPLTLPHYPSASNHDSTKRDLHKMPSQSYTPYEVERKRQEAIEKRRQKLKKTKLYAKCPSVTN